MKPISLDKICEILEVKNPFGNKIIEYVCFREKLIKKNSLYFTIITEGFDGYDFNFQKIKDSESIVISTKQISDLPCIIVEDSLKSLYKIAQYCRQEYETLKTVVVTGSIGKTSTKEMVYSTLQAHAKTLRNSGSANSCRETCRLVFNTDDEVEHIVMELGLRSPNKPFVNSSKILAPDAVLITNIGNSHIENFNSKAHILEHKLSAAAHLKPDGVLVLNGDDELLFNTQYSHKTIFFGIHNEQADYLAKDIKMTNDGIDFIAVSKNGELNIPLHLNAVGEHNILNALASVVIGKLFNLTDEEIQAGIANYQPTGFRNNVVKGYKNNIIIADCNNATPESMISGFETLKSIDCKGRKIAILGHMMRLGKHSERLHRQTGKDVLKYNFDLILTFGLDAHYIYEEVKNAGKPAIEFFSKPDLVKFLRDYVKEEDAILFKGVEKFHNFSDLFYDFNNPDYQPPEEFYGGAYANDIACHSDAEALYFGDNSQCYIRKNIHKKIHVKDILLVIAAIMVIENSNLSDKVTISSLAASKFVKNTSIRFNSTNIFTVEDLVYAMMFKSSFEAAYALIEHAFGDFNNFRNALSEKFKELGIVNTSISSFSHQISTENYTTAFDMYIITKYALKNPEFVKIISGISYTLTNHKSGRQTPIFTNNKLLTHEPKVSYLDYFSKYALGIKCENIYDEANEIKCRSLISCIQKDDDYIVGIILGSDEFYYCNNTYIDMKRIFEKVVKYSCPATESKA